jgi:hypothetical protein
MSGGETCDTHTWASVGVVTDQGAVYRVWTCEQCPAWTMEPFAPDHEQPWDETWLAER